MASSAGLNRYGVPLLVGITAATAAVAPSGTTTSGYGTLVSTDPKGSGIANDTGVYAVEAIGFTKLGFQLIGNLSGSGSVSVFSTFDPLAYAVFLANNGQDGVTSGTLKGVFTAGGYTISPGGVVSLPVTSWTLMAGPSQQTGEGTTANPLTTSSPLFISGYAPVAVRAVVTAQFTGGAGSLVMFGVP